ncbi:MAG: hypothetical protein U0798_20530 [Gemmataceae bacterium]
MSLVRVGMSDNKKVSEGWDAVFGKNKKKPAEKKPAAKAAAKAPKTKKK